MTKGPAYVLAFKKLGDIFFKKIEPLWLRQYLAILSFGILLYLAGLVIASICGLYSIFINCWITLLVILGIMWVSLAICYAFNKYEPLLKDIRNSFDLSDNEYNQRMNRHLNALSEDRKRVFWLVASVILFDLIACTGIYIYDGMNPMLQNAQLLLSCPLYLIYSIVIMSLCISQICCGAFLLISFSLFIRALCKDPVKIRIVGPIHTELYKLAKFSLIFSLTWFAGVSLIACGTVTVSNPLTIAFLVIVTLIGFSTFLIPQWYVHESIKREKESLLKELGEKFEQEYNEIKTGENMINVLTLCTLFEEIKKIDEWAFGKGEISKLVLYSLLPSLIAVFV